MDHNALVISSIQEEVAYMKDMLKSQAINEIKKMHSNFDFMNQQLNIVKDAQSRSLHIKDLNEINDKFDKYVPLSSLNDLEY